MGSWDANQLSEAQRWSENIGDSPETYAGRVRLAKRLVAADPSSALALMDSAKDVDGFEYELEALMETWAATDVSSAWHSSRRWTERGRTLRFNDCAN